MGTYSLDIETASPYEKPDDYDDFRDTKYFEFVCVNTAHWSAPDATPESTVLFRDGSWESEHTADLIRRLVEDAQQHDIDTILTFNGNRFDLLHLMNWADQCVEDGTLDPNIRDELAALFDDTYHIDLMECVLDENNGYFKSFEDTCRWKGVEMAPTKYSDYDLPAELDLGSVVTGEHIGETLGETYVEWTISDERPPAYDELVRLLTDYGLDDVEPLIELAKAFGEIPRQSA